MVLCVNVSFLLNVENVNSDSAVVIGISNPINIPYPASYIKRDFL